MQHHVWNSKAFSEWNKTQKIYILYDSFNAVLEKVKLHNDSGWMSSGGGKGGE